jgi:DNA-binding LacI/PurR family transcriptional regulator/DNA-binding transcriptional regulator YhcF (GntR family)
MNQDSSASRSKPKVTKACALITEMSRKLGAHAKLPTISEMCERFDVSRGTIDIALHELEEKNIIYRLHAVGIFVSPQIKRVICILRDPHNSDFDKSPFWQLIVEAQQRQAKFFGFDTIVEDVVYHGMKGAEPDLIEPYDYVGHGEPYPISQKLVEDLKNERVHGLLGTVVDNRVARRLIADFPQTPFVSLAGYAHWRVVFHTAGLIDLATSALLKQGCHKIGMWKDRADIPNATDELQLALLTAELSMALLGQGLTFYPELIHMISAYSEKSREEQGVLLVRKVFSPRGKQSRIEVPDGIIVHNDFVARGAIHALDDMGIVVGRDVHLAVQSNSGSPLLREHEQRITRLEYNLDEIACTMLEFMDNILTRGHSSIRIAQVQPQTHLPPVLAPDRSRS